ncbi:MAG TPA: 1,4-alpha-glucan branching enzyme, partial [Pirellulales bacterium]|nr:1,4-alpha-glucan branching enzyme [Pirellulales bacterium]
MRTPIALESVSKLIAGRHENPFELLGPHQVTIDDQPALAVRAFAPHSAQAWIIDKRGDGARRPMRRIHPGGLFEAICLPGEPGRIPPYLLQFADERGNQVTMHDPYAFPTLLTDFDRHLLNEGTHWTAYERLGAHLRT